MAGDGEDGSAVGSLLDLLPRPLILLSREMGGTDLCQQLLLCFTCSLVGFSLAYLCPLVISFISSLLESRSRAGFLGCRMIFLFVHLLALDLLVPDNIFFVVVCVSGWICSLVGSVVSGRILFSFDLFFRCRKILPEF